MTDRQEPAVVHQPERTRFVVDLGDDGKAVMTYEVPQQGVMDITHTWVPVARRGHGLGAQVVLTALRYADAQGLRVIPTCPFVSRVLRDHPEWKRLLVQ